MDNSISNAASVASVRVLNKIVLHPDQIDVLGIDENLFNARTIDYFRAIESLYRDKADINETSIYERMTKDGKESDFGIIGSFYNFSDGSGDISDAIADMKEERRSYKLNESLNEFTATYSKIERFDDKSRQQLKDALFDIEEQLGDNDSEEKLIKYLPDIKEKYLAEFEKRKGGRIYTFNNKILDDILEDGPVPGEGGLITASTGMGKTAFALNVMNDLYNANIPTMLFELEMGDINTMDRWLSLRTGIPYKDIKHPKSQEDFELVKKELDKEFKHLELNNERWAICEKATLSLADIRREARKFQIKTGQKYFILLLDLISMIQDFTSPEKGLSLAGQMEIAINRVNAMAKELGFHWLGLVQLNRSVEQDKVMDIDDIDRLRPNRAAIKNSGALLERCRYCLSLFRKKYYAEAYLEKEEAEVLEDIIEVGLMKASNAQVGKRFMMFQPEIFKCSPLLNTNGEAEEEH